MRSVAEYLEKAAEFDELARSTSEPALKNRYGGMSSAPNPQSDADQLEAAANQAIAACGGDAREAVKALIVANHLAFGDHCHSLTSFRANWRSFASPTRRGDTYSLIFGSKG
jgi:hypothetical protein